MKRKGVFLLGSLIITAALVAAACSSPATTTTPTRTTAATTTSPKTTTVAPTTAADKPQYGGTLTVLQATDVTVFDPASQGQLAGATVGLTNEQFVFQDWTQGLAGSAKVDWITAGQAMENYSPWLAESFTIPEPGVTVFKVRRGVHYSLNPNSEASRLVNGREMTADDWVENFNYMMSKPNTPYKSFEPKAYAASKMEKTGAWEVKFTGKDDMLSAWHWIAYGGGFMHLWPPEVAKKYGSNGDWRNSVGTGPWILTDFVPGSAATLAKNQNYWATDPLGPGKGSKLPYIDGIKMLIVPDLSSRLAAARTGRADMISGIEGEDARSLQKTNPDLKFVKYFGATVWLVGMRTDKQDLPFKDKRVRQALMMATDFNAMKQQLYGGDAEYLVYPVTKDFKAAYAPMESLPANVQDLYKYNPDKAKALLKEAGYPSGFKTTMIVNATNAPLVDVASTYKAMWAKVGVDVEIQPKEAAVWNSIYYARSYDQTMLTYIWMIYPTYLNLGSVRGPTFGNPSYINDPPGSEPTIQAAYEKIQANTFTNQPEANKLFKALVPYLLEQANYIERPSPYLYTFWWPWIKNYHGEGALQFAKFYWLDVPLKRQMGK